MYLRACGEIVLPIGDTLTDLKDLVADAVGQPVRRISRFIQLAIVGAGRCAQGHSLPRNTAVYLASSRGDLELTVDVMNMVFREGQSPKPLSFVNTVSNSAAFYVAKCVGLQSRSAFVCSRYFAFEDALQLALVDFQLGIVDSALIGCVESAVRANNADHDPTELDRAAPTAEASHWMWFTRERGAHALAQTLDVRTATSQEEVIDWVNARSTDAARTSLSAGPYLTSSDFNAIQARTGITQSFDYRRSNVRYSSQSAAAIPLFANSGGTDGSLLHVNRDPLGRYVSMLVKRLA